MPVDQFGNQTIPWLPPNPDGSPRVITQEMRDSLAFRRDPVGASQGALGDLQGSLVGAFRRSQGPGLEAAINLLGERGAVDDRALDLGRRDIETRRQLLQQDIGQRAAQGGLSGAFATQALRSQANISAQDATARLEEDQAFQQDLRRRQDIAGIFNALSGPGLSLLGAKRPGVEDTTPSTLQSAAQLGGNILGFVNMFRSLRGE